MVVMDCTKKAMACLVAILAMLCGEIDVNHLISILNPPLPSPPDL